MNLSTKGRLMLCLTKNRLEHTWMPSFADDGSEDIFSSSLILYMYAVSCHLPDGAMIISPMLSHFNRVLCVNICSI